MVTHTHGIVYLPRVHYRIPTAPLSWCVQVPPDQLLMDGNQLWAADADAVVVLQAAPRKVRWKCFSAVMLQEAHFLPCRNLCGQSGESIKVVNCRTAVWLVIGVGRQEVQQR